MKRGPTVPPAVRRGPVGSRRGPGGPVGTPWGPVWVLHQLCTNMGQSSDPSSLVGSRRAQTGFRRKPVGTRYGRQVLMSTDG